MISLKCVNVLCGAYFVLLATATAQQCSTRLSGKLLLAEEVSIVMVDGYGKNREILTRSKAISLDYDYQRNVLYWADIRTSEIYALDEKSLAPRVVVPKQKEWLAFSIAVESVTGKLYVGDSHSGIIRIFDLKHDNNIAIVLGSDISQVRCLAIDANAGYLFVLVKYQILRIDLDGANRKMLLQIEEDESENKNELQIMEIIYREHLSVDWILADHENNRLYWVDSLTRNVESIDYDGQNRKVHFHDSDGLPFTVSLDSLAILDGYLYWSDPVQKHFIMIDVETGKSSDILSPAPQFLKAISCPTQKPIANPCDNNNGQCKQLCLLSKSHQNNYKCACDIGYELAEDQKTCTVVRDFLLFTEDNYIRGLSIGVDGKEHVDVINPWQFRLGGAAIIEYNVEARMVYHNHHIYYYNNRLYQVSLDSGEETQLRPDLHSQDARNLAYDWASKNLYYFSYYHANVLSLNVLNVENPIYLKFLLNDVQSNVTHMIVHPHKGYVYYAQLVSAQDARISRVTTDGSNLTVIIKLSENNSIEGLAIDFEEDRLYWSQTERDENDKVSFRLRHSNLDGTDIQDVLLPSDVPGLLNLDIHGGHIYAINGPRTQLVRLNKKNISSDKLVLAEDSESGTLGIVKLFSKKAQSVNRDHPCAKGKNQCIKFCFAVPNDNGGVKGICGCPYGERLAEDGKFCVDNSKAEPPLDRR